MYNSAQFLYAGNALKNGGALRLLGEMKTSARNGTTGALPLYNRNQSVDNKSVQSSLKNLLDLKNGSTRLGAAADTLSRAGSARTAVSSAPDKVEVSARSAGTAALLKPTSVQVGRLAAGQVNQGYGLSAGGKNFATGRQSLSVEHKGASFALSVDVAADDTNKTVQDKIAAAVNAQKTGVTAAVQTDPESGASALVLSSATGEQNSFTVRDTAGGNLAATAGIERTTREAQDAAYSLNGGPTRTSASNDIDLGFGVTASLRQTTSEPVRVAPGLDTGKAKQALTELTEGFNTLSATANENSGSIAATRLAQRLNSIFSASASALASVGITADENGRMETDAAALDQATTNGRLADFLSNSASGLSARLSSTADSVRRDPVAFAGFNRLADTMYNYLTAADPFTFASQDFGYAASSNKGYFLNTLA
jgi:flagellar capping protein FliD